MASNTTNGKAFEFACLKAIYDKLMENGKKVYIDDSIPYQNTVKDFNDLPKAEQQKYMAAAISAAKLIFPLEPKLEHGAGELLLEINPDSVAQGVNGDVRDVLCIRSKDNENWEIGLSCKHNHAALKHPRITADKDFGKNWVGIANSKEFIDEISATIDKLIDLARQGVKWQDLSPKEKFGVYYVPILTAYKNEIIRMCNTYPEVPKRLLSYFFGSKDFYKVIMDEGRKTTKLEAFNMNNTLNRKEGKIKPLVKIPVTNMPTELITADFLRTKSGKTSNTTLLLRFDENWVISMRLHNKDKKVSVTSLAWDVQLKGLPEGTYINIRPWYEND